MDYYYLLRNPAYEGWNEFSIFVLGFDPILHKSWSKTSYLEFIYIFQKIENLSPYI